MIISNKIKHNILPLVLFSIMYLGVFCKIFLNKNIPVGEDWAIPVSSVQLKNWLISNVYAWSDWSNIFGKRLSYSVALPFQTLGYFLNTTLSIDGYCYWKVLFFFSFLIYILISYIVTIARFIRRIIKDFKFLN